MCWRIFAPRLLPGRSTHFPVRFCRSGVSPRRIVATRQKLQGAKNKKRHRSASHCCNTRSRLSTIREQGWRRQGRWDTLSTVKTSVSEPAPTTIAPSRGIRLAGLTGFLFAILQSICTAVLALSGVRVAIGLTALAAASGIYAPAKGFHQDAIRIPMLVVGSLGAIANLAVLFRVWHLRSRSSAHWRRRTLSKRERTSERLQLALAVLTLLLVGLEFWTHSLVHRTGSPPASQTQSTAR